MKKDKKQKIDVVSCTIPSGKGNLSIVSWDVDGGRMKVTDEEIHQVIGVVLAELKYINPLYSVLLSSDSNKEVIFLYDDDFVDYFKELHGNDYDGVMHEYFTELWKSTMVHLQ